jgi:hypothetical protein
MEGVDGSAYRLASELQTLGPQRAAEIKLNLIDTVSASSRRQPLRVELQGSDVPTVTWHGRSRAGADRWSHLKSARCPAPTICATLLAATLPDEQPPALVPGDFHLDNVTFGADGRRVAVLDCEMATLENPLTELALMLTYRPVSGLDAARQPCSKRDRGARVDQDLP